MSIDLENQQLGESTEIIRTESHEDIAQALLVLAQQSTRRLDIFSHELERRIYNSDALQQALLKLATRTRHTKIRIIVKDATKLVKQGSRLVNLSHRLSSHIEIRTPPIEYRDHSEEFAVVDDTGFVYRPIATRYDGDVCFHEPIKARQLVKFFEECWLKSGADPNLRRLDI